MKRFPLTLVAALLAAALLATLTVAAPTAEALSGAERALVRELNDIRAQHGLPRMHADRGLSRAADRHSRDMLSADFFDHTSSDGTPFDRRIRRYADAGMIGETLAALPQRYGGAAEIAQMWMDSPPHREILLVGEFRRIGIARRWGTLGGAGQAVVTADFASDG